MQRAAALPVIVSISTCESLQAETADVELALGVDDLLRKPRGLATSSARSSSTMSRKVAEQPVDMPHP
jgi:hypothetical protein